MAWHLVNSNRKKKNGTVTSLWEVHGFILVAIMPKSTTVNSNAYVMTLTKLEKCTFLLIRALGRWLKFCSNTSVPNLTPVCETYNPPPHWDGLCCHTKIYRHNLTSSDFHIFVKLKDTFRGTLSEDGSCENVAEQCQC